MKASAWVKPGLCAFLVALPTASCTVADNLSANEMIVEIDNVVEVAGTGADRSIRYAEFAEVTTWYMRFWLCWPIRQPLGALFGVRNREELTAAPAHVRELLLELPDETGGNPVECAWAAARMAWLAEFDTSPQTRVAAIDGLAAMLEQLHLPAFQGPFERLGAPLPAAALAIARAGIQAGRPEVRPANAPDAALSPYRTALSELTQAPLSAPDERILLVEELTRLWLAETDDATAIAAERALEAALVHMVQGVLLRSVEGREPEFVPVRLCAMEHIRRFGGAASVPLLLAAMAASPADRAVISHFDDDDLIQLRLIHLCGQLRGDALRGTVRLPGREDWVPMSPGEFLAMTILRERSYSSKLRVPALFALTWGLGRPRLDPDPQWVREWHEAELTAERPR